MRTLASLLPLALLAACKDSPPAQPAPAEPAAPTPAQPAQPAPPPVAVDPSAPPTDLVKGANKLALDLWQHMPAGNLAVSPASLAIPLTVAWGGAKGETATQIASLLGLSGPADIVLSRWGNLAKSLVDGSRSVTLKIANRIYGEKTYEIDTTYFTIARHAFDVWIEPVDFVGAADAAREKINTWVAEQTERRIENLLPPGSVSPQTKLVIVNAIYFLGDWKYPFDKAQTQPRPFWVDGTTQAQVPTMQRRGAYPHATGTHAQLIELPYTGDSMAMYVLVPTERRGLAAVEKQLGDTLRELQPQLASRTIDLRLPRFTIDPPEPLRLEGALQALGMKNAFSRDAADFTGLANPKDPRDRLYISTVLHKAFVKVDEQGTEAAAATAIATKGTGGPPAPPLEVNVDRPFLFVIVDKATGLLMFVGRVVDPR